MGCGVSKKHSVSPSPQNEFSDEGGKRRSSRTSIASHNREGPSHISSVNSINIQRNDENSHKDVHMQLVDESKTAASADCNNQKLDIVQNQTSIALQSVTIPRSADIASDSKEYESLSQHDEPTATIVGQETSTIISDSRREDVSMSLDDNAEVLFDDAEVEQLDIMKNPPPPTPKQAESSPQRHNKKVISRSETPLEDIFKISIHAFKNPGKCYGRPVTRYNCPYAITMARRVPCHTPHHAAKGQFQATKNAKIPQKLTLVDPSLPTNFTASTELWSGSPMRGVTPNSPASSLTPFGSTPVHARDIPSALATQPISPINSRKRYYDQAAQSESESDSESDSSSPASPTIFRFTAALLHTSIDGRRVECHNHKILSIGKHVYDFHKSFPPFYQLYIAEVGPLYLKSGSYTRCSIFTEKPYFEDEDLYRPHILAAVGDDQDLRRFFSSISNLTHVYDVDGDGMTPLFMATYCRRLDAMKALLEYGSDPQHYDHFQRNLAHLAALLGDHLALDIILTAGCEVNAKDCEGATPLHYAIYGGYPLVVDLLLERGADPRICDNNGKSPVHWACCVGDPTLVEQLKSFIPSSSVADADQVTHLMYAISSKNIDCARIVVSQYDNERLNLLDNTGSSALHYACAVGNPAIVELLLCAGVNADQRSSSGVSPLHHAALVGSADITEMLLQRNVDPHALDGEFKTPLIWAIANGRTSVIDKFILNEKNTPSLKGRPSPRDWAIACLPSELAEYICMLVGDVDGTCDPSSHFQQSVCLANPATSTSTSTLCDRNTRQELAYILASENADMRSEPGTSLPQPTNRPAIDLFRQRLVEGDRVKPADFALRVCFYLRGSILDPHEREWNTRSFTASTLLSPSDLPDRLDVSCDTSHTPVRDSRSWTDADLTSREPNPEHTPHEWSITSGAWDSFQLSLHALVGDEDVVICQCTRTRQDLIADLKRLAREVGDPTQEDADLTTIQIPREADVARGMVHSNDFGPGAFTIEVEMSHRPDKRLVVDRFSSPRYSVPIHNLPRSLAVDRNRLHSLFIRPWELS